MAEGLGLHGDQIRGADVAVAVRVAPRQKAQQALDVVGDADLLGPGQMVARQDRLDGGLEDGALVGGEEPVEAGTWCLRGRGDAGQQGRAKSQRAGGGCHELQQAAPAEDQRVPRIDAFGHGGLPTRRSSPGLRVGQALVEPRWSCQQTGRRLARMVFDTEAWYGGC